MGVYGSFEGNDCIFPKCLTLDVSPACAGGICIYPKFGSCPWLPYYAFPCKCGGCYAAVFGASIPLVLATTPDKDTIMRWDPIGFMKDPNTGLGMGFARKAGAGTGAPPAVEMQR